MYEAEVCRSLVFFVNAAAELVQSELPLGSGIENLVKVLTKFYTTASLLTKYFFARCRNVKGAAKESRFDTLTTRVGRDLTKNIYEFINHIQQLETDESTSTSKEKKVRQNCLT